VDLNSIVLGSFGLTPAYQTGPFWHDLSVRQIPHDLSIDPFLYVSRLLDQDLYKLRVGDYRVLMTIQHTKLIMIVVEVSHRRNVYK
jgi:hypothetical protein